MATSSQELDARFREGRRKAEEADAKRRATKLGYEYFDLVSVKVPTELKAMEIVPEAEARAARLSPLQILRKQLVVAAFDPKNPETERVLEGLRKKYRVHVVVVSLAGLEHAWSHYMYVRTAGKDISGRVKIDEARLREVQKSILNFDSFAEVIGLLSSQTSEALEAILGGALRLQASDIHLEPTEGLGVLRLRVDGILHPAFTEIDPHAYRSLITRIKLLSNLKLNVSREPQDGRFTIDLQDAHIEIRTSIIPSEYGETAVLRILDPSALKINLEELGWREDDLKIIEEVIARPNGLVLVTGPTGSGKTTTLYAFLKKVFTSEIKIITIEDPIEYHLSGISQTQVRDDANYTFASGLRSILRQDPDVILVGEIRDKETAEIALNASLTGHLVFSTLHTNDAVGAIPRLFDLGVKYQVLGPAISLVIAQRLVRRLCTECKKPVSIDDETRGKISHFLGSLPKRVSRVKYQAPTIFEPGACGACGNLGYKGRTSIFELFLVTDSMEELIYTDPTETDIKKKAREAGMVFMQEDGILKVLCGETSLAEVLRLTGKIEW
ncbi:MAG: GspE/PulE family protein [Nanoarchaeota archaeon]|nr:GspE/PulE family protein [Nanoarchaeota archaeon]